MLTTLQSDFCAALAKGALNFTEISTRLTTIASHDKLISTSTQAKLYKYLCNLKDFDSIEPILKTIDSCSIELMLIAFRTLESGTFCIPLLISAIDLFESQPKPSFKMLYHALWAISKIKTRQASQILKEKVINIFLHKTEQSLLSAEQSVLLLADTTWQELSYTVYHLRYLKMNPGIRFLLSTIYLHLQKDPTGEILEASEICRIMEGLERMWGEPEADDMLAMLKCHIEALKEINAYFIA